MSPDQAASTHKWYDISSKKKDDKVVASVMIYGEIGWDVSSREFVKELTAIDADTIEVRINSVGGDVFDGVAIYNALRQHSAEVIVTVEGLAASAASFIAQAGDEVNMLRGSEMMIHDASALAWGNEEVMLRTASILGRISNNIASIYSERAGGTPEEWRAIMQAEMWYSPEEAVAAGLADNAVDDEDEKAVAAKNGWDLKVFNYAGRKEAPSPVEETRRIINQVKETSMPHDPAKATVVPDGETPVAPPAPEPPAVPTPPAPDAEPAPAEGEEEGDEQGDGGTPAEPSADGGTPPVNLAPGTYMVYGKPTTDQRSVQNHIATLEAIVADNKVAARKGYIDSLAKPTDGSQPKILASQITAMEQFVATMSDEQFALWKATMDASPSVALLQPHGQGGEGTPTGTAAQAQADRIEVLKGIVDHHKKGGMKSELIEATDSYKELKQLQPDFTL